MADIFEFHNGSEKLELNAGVLDGALNYDDDLENWMKSQKNQHWFYQEFLRDVSGFEEKVREVTDSFYSESTSEILEFILSGKEYVLDLIGTALVHCNFTDVSRLIRDLSSRLERQKGDTVLVTDSDEIHTIFDRIKNTKGRCIIIIKQFESLRSNFLDSLLTLIRSDLYTRQVISQLKLVVCVSTGSGYFNSRCTTDSLDLLMVKNFKFAEAGVIFDKINSIDVSPAIYSGGFTNYVRSRYFDNDLSVDAVVKTTKFALLSKYIDKPLWKKASHHKEEMDRYWRVLQLFITSLKRVKDVNINEFHTEVQTTPTFWDKFSQDRILKEWRHIMLEERNLEALLKFAEEVRIEIETVDEELWAQTEYAIERLHMVMENEANNVSPTKEPTTPSSKKKMSLNEFRKQQATSFAAKLDNPVRNNKNIIIDLTLTSLQKLLTQWPETWENLINCDLKLLDAQHERHLESVLLTEQNSEDLLSIGWKTLLAQKGWKSVVLADWANSFVQQVSTLLPPEDVQPAFFAVAGYLELLGIIKPAADRKNINVNVLHHPLTCVPMG